mmetsp:Transcript_17005/g.52202  ORF Transcript_17005/g.52202 Transcript_17005/m.52202 type:complete len:171 (+) Transcript_17005:2896-3408(+)
MDNAAYHWSSELSERLAETQTKAEVYELLKGCGATTIKVVKGEEMKVFEVDERLLQRANGHADSAPNRKELREAAIRWLKANRPQLMKSKAAAALDNVDDKDVWLPPYCTCFNAIAETFWAVGKNNAAAKFKGSRSIEQVIKDVREGWYGTQADGSGAATIFFFFCHMKF